MGKSKMTGSETRGEVFIVDDDPTVRDVVSEVFAQAGYRAISFVDGASFVAAARERIHGGQARRELLPAQAVRAPGIVGGHQLASRCGVSP
jgi:FixJ family two-component response regulator